MAGRFSAGRDSGGSRSGTDLWDTHNIVGELRISDGNKCGNGALSILGADEKKPGRSNLFSALMMFAGVCLLTVDFNNITAVNAGDLLSFLGAFLYAVHIAVTGKLSGTVRPKAVTCLQFLALFTVNLLFVPLEETPFIIPPAAVLPAAYLGIVSIFIGHTLQIICQEKGRQHESSPCF